jgi:hypothetical protein
MYILDYKSEGLFIDSLISHPEITDNRLPVYKVIDPLISQSEITVNKLPVYKVIDPLISHPDNRLPVYLAVCCQ